MVPRSGERANFFTNKWSPTSSVGNMDPDGILNASTQKVRTSCAPPPRRTSGARSGTRPQLVMRPQSPRGVETDEEVESDDDTAFCAKRRTVSRRRAYEQPQRLRVRLDARSR